MTGSVRKNKNAKHHYPPTSEIIAAMLRWYDQYARVLPWRAQAGERNSAYHVWLSEIMLQQTTVQAVAPYYNRFVSLWTRVEDLAGASQEQVLKEWAGLGYYARARNLHKCAKVIAEDFGGIFPSEEKKLLSLPGIGPYTAAAIRAIAFDRPSVVVDGNIERVMARLFSIQTPLPEAKAEIKAAAAYVASALEERFGDYAQSLMDLGAMICTPKSPNCAACPLATYCLACQQNVAADLPRRAPKKQSPKKHGFVYWVENTKGEILFETRPETGLLGNMVGLPTGKWTLQSDGSPKKSTKFGRTQKYGKTVRHVFTHFELTLFPRIARAYEADIAPHQFWVKRQDISALGLPNLFLKVARLFEEKESL